MFLVAALNGLKVLSTDVGNAYLNAECREKVHVKCGKELFGPEHEGKYTVIALAVYGLMVSLTQVPEGMGRQVPSQARCIDLN